MRKCYFLELFQKQTFPVKKKAPLDHHDTRTEHFIQTIRKQRKAKRLVGSKNKQ